MRLFNKLILVPLAILGSIANAATIDDMAVGSWLELPNSKLRSVVPSVTAPGSITNIMAAWNGGAYDTKRDRLLIWGGGHRDYGGNEIYGYSLSSLSWDLVEASTPNSLIRDNETGEQYDDGKPVARHTYDGIEYLPEPFDSFVSHGGSRWKNGYGTDAIWEYDFGSSAWGYKGRAESGSLLGISTAYDPVSQTLLIHGKDKTSAYDPATGQATVLYTNSVAWPNSNVSAAFDPNRRYMVVMGNGQFDVFDYTTKTYFRPSLNGDTSIINANGPGLVYDSASDKIVAWNGGSSIYTLDLDTWTWKQVSSSQGASPGSVTASGGTFSRFQYVPSKNIFLVVNSIDTSVFAFKLSDGAGTGSTTGGTVPQASNDITSIQFSDSSSSNRNDLYVTYGHAFKKGDVPAGSGLELVMNNGDVLPIQVDKKATHADGSLRHAVITSKLATLSANEIKDAKFVSVGASNSGAGVSVDALLNSGFDAEIKITLNGTTYTANPRSRLLSNDFSNWLSGPLASERIVIADFIAGNGSVHPHLKAHFYIRAYENVSNVKVDFVIENNWSYVAQPKNQTYDVVMKLNGSQVYSKNGLEHFHHARWHKVFWTQGDPEVEVVFNIPYIFATRAVPNLDQSVVVDSAITTIANELAGSNNAPMGRSMMRQYMPGTGAAKDIGPLPSWASAYLLSMDKRVKDATLAVGDAGGSWSIHYRDVNTSQPTSVIDYPYMSLDADRSDTYNPATGSYEGFPDCGGDCGSPYSPDSAHQPSIAFVPYLITGDYFYMEELMFWANYNVLQFNPAYRGYGKGLVNRGQVRAQAWSMRTLGQTAYILPDNHEMKNYFTDLVENNMQWYNQTYTNDGVTPLGFVTSGYALAYNDGAGIAPWQDDFLTWSTGYLAAMGFESASIFLDWKAKYVIGRMVGEGVCWIGASAYSMNVRPSSSEAYYRSFGEMYSRTSLGQSGTACASQEMANYLGLRTGEMVGYAYSEDGYVANMQPALAVAASSNVPGASQAWNIFSNRSFKSDYSAQQNFAVVPYENSISSTSPSLVLNLDNYTVNPGDNVRVTWSAVNTDSCTASGNWSGAKSTSGNTLISTVMSDKTFTLSCSGNQGSVSKSVAVVVIDGAGSGGGNTGGAGNADPVVGATNIEDFGVNGMTFDFDGLSVGANPDNWMDTNSDALTENDSLFSVMSVDGGNVFGTVNTSATNIHSHYLDGIGTWSDYRYSGRMKATGASDSIGVTFYSDYPNSDTYYRLRTNAGASFRIAPHGSGIECSGVNNTGVTPAANKWYKFKIEVQNMNSSTNIRARVWQEGSSEPAGWQANCSDSGTRLNSGAIGLWAVVNGSDTGKKYWDDLSVVSLNVNAGTDTGTGGTDTGTGGTDTGTGGTDTGTGGTDTGTGGTDTGTGGTDTGTGGTGGLSPSEDVDADGIPDSWEMDNFNGLNVADAESDFDADGLLDIEEFMAFTDPNESDSDADGFSDLDEVNAGANPNLNTDTPEHHVPMQPIIISNNSLVFRDVILQGSEFYDPDVGDKLFFSRWVITSNGNLILDRLVSKRAELNVPIGVLEYGQDYEVKVAYLDDQNLMSSWSDAIAFSVMSDPSLDSEADGTDDEYQISGNIDINHNGIDDAQENICYLQTFDKTEVIGIEALSGKINCITVFDADLVNTDAVNRDTFPFGLFTFTVTDLVSTVEDPAKVVVRIYMPDSFDAKQWIKYDEVSGNSYDASDIATFENNIVTLNLQDGLAEDVDGVVNGVIVDPGGVSVDTKADDAESSNGSEPNGGGGSINQWVLFMLLLLFVGRQYSFSRKSN